MNLNRHKMTQIDGRGNGFCIIDNAQIEYHKAVSKGKSYDHLP